MNDTVFALSTPVGGAIAIIRISGANTRALLGRLFQGRAEHRRASFGRIVDEKGETVDTCTVTCFDSPHSYTGEDTAEIALHGSLAVVRRVSELIAGTGLARPAEPGEFTKRAYLNGKMDLAQAEAVMDLIASSAERSRRAAAMQLEGRLSAVIGSLYARTKAACAMTAAYMDDESGEMDSAPEEIGRRIEGLNAEIAALIKGGMRSRVLREGARAAIIGSPNVGKSSLLNALLLRERAIVTDIPGTTRDTLEEPASIEGVPVVFVDTAGIRETEDEVEKIGVQRAGRELENADIVLLVIDSSRDINESDAAIIKRAAEKCGQKTLAVLTKSDLAPVVLPGADGRFEFDNGGETISLPAVRISAVTGEGLDALRAAAAAMIAPTESETTVTNGRHIAALERANACLSSAAEELYALPDAAYQNIREAMELLGSIVGRADTAEELVDEIFASFCMGK